MAACWFGDSWGAPFNDCCPHVRTPVGEPCAGCPEPIQAGESGVLTTCTGADLVVSWLAYHLECWLMLPVHCHMRPPEEPGVTTRERARAADPVT